MRLLPEWMAHIRAGCCGMWEPMCSASVLGDLEGLISGRRWTRHWRLRGLRGKGYGPSSLQCRGMLRMRRVVFLCFYIFFLLSASCLEMLLCV